MDDQEKYRAKIEARMKYFNASIEEITTKTKLRKVIQPDIKIEHLMKKNEHAQARLKDMEKSDENSWQKFQEELDQLVADIDTDLRKAMAYFG
ncbi:MAG: hypothetical protein PVF37_15000 [Desulfobacterales bacterium]